MTSPIENLVEKLTSPESKQRLVSFMGVMTDILNPRPIVITDDEECQMIVTQENGVPVVRMSKMFIASMGSFKLVVRGGLVRDTVYEPQEPVVENVFTPGLSDYLRLVNNNYMVFEKIGGIYNIRFRNSLLENITDTNIVNYIKRNNVEEGIYNMIIEYLKNHNIKHYTIGDVWPEQTAASNPTIVYHDRPVVTEKVVHVEKVVKTEVPVYVDKIVIKEVYKCEHTDKSIPIIKEVDAVIAKTKQITEQADEPKPKKKLIDPDEDIDDKKTSESEEEESSSSEEESSEEEEEEETEESQESVVEESSSDEEPEPPKKTAVTPVQKRREEPKKEAREDVSESVLRLKGTFLNKEKTILRTGDYVYRVNKKVNGPTALQAIGRWDKRKKERVPLLNEDKKKIKALGYEIAQTV